jgi:ABC-type polar amino acid transport system ATPase subunit
MRRRSIMKIVEKRNKKKLNRYRRHYEMLFETLQIVSHPTKPNNVESKDKSIFKSKNPNTKQKPMTLKSLQHNINFNP